MQEVESLAFHLYGNHLIRQRLAISLDGKEILVEHRFEDVTLKEYRGRTAVSLQHQIARDVAVSDINHAIYLGRQLAKAEMALKDGREFVQD